jgi:GWxTD domain-containing protein
VLLFVPLLVLALGTPPASAVDPKKEDFELINPLLGPELSQWLVGPISWIASEKEIQEYLQLTSSEAAESFIEEFWAERDPYPQRPDNPAKKLYEDRMKDATAQYEEAGQPGWKTPRGRVFVTYGEPDDVDYEVAPDPGDPLIEVWVYEKGTEKGLDGKKPDRRYRFIKRGELTDFYQRQRNIDRRRYRATTPPDFRRP